MLIDTGATEARNRLVGRARRGCALTRDGQWFLYESIVYRTSHEWRRYFMPVYRALKTEKQNTNRI